MDNFKIILIILFSIILIINYKDIFLSEDFKKKSESELYDNLRKNYSKKQYNILKKKFSKESEVKNIKKFLKLI